MNDVVQAFTVYDDSLIAPDLISGGFFTMAGGIDANRIAQWDGALWRPMADFDCNNNGVLDAEDIASGTSDDYNLDGTPDECDDPPVPETAMWQNPAGTLSAVLELGSGHSGDRGHGGVRSR